MPTTAAVVSTQRSVKHTLASFLRWHLDGARFDHVYIYADDPSHDAEALAAVGASTVSRRLAQSGGNVRRADSSSVIAVMSERKRRLCQLAAEWRVLCSCEHGSRTHAPAPSARAVQGARLGTP